MNNNSLVVTTEEMFRVKNEYLSSTAMDNLNLTEVSAISCAWHLLHNFGPFSEDHIIICAGPKENGGLGLAIAFYLAKYTKKISICMPLAPSDSLTIQNKKRLVNFYPAIEFIPDLVNGDLYIDALMGVSDFSQEIDISLQETIKTLNHQTAPLIAIDVPSGTNPNTGKAIVAVEADVTLAIGALKPIHQQPRQKNCGHVSLIDIGLPNSLIANHHVVSLEKAS